MKTEKEVRAYRDALRKIATKPCGCAASEHALECFIGGKMLAANEGLLSWLLGENEAHQEIVDHMRRSAAAETN